jgi:hypothetical protein
MTARWGRRVEKLPDFKFEFGPGCRVWSQGRHEPLLICVCLPLSKHMPWKLKGTKLVESLEGKMRELHKTNCRGRGRHLRKLLIRSKWLDSVPEGMVWGLLQRAEHRSLPDKARGRR